MDKTLPFLNTLQYSRFNTKQLLVLLLVLITNLLFSQAPINDDFANAIDVSSIINGCSTDALYKTVSGTPDRLAGTAWNNGGPRQNVWFKFVAPASGQINITVDTEFSKGTQRRTQVALWQANGTTEIKSKRYISDYDDVVVGATGLTAGGIYYISVDSSSGYYGTFTLCLNDKVDYDFYEGAIDVTTMINGCSADAVYDTRGGSPDKTIGANWNNSGPLYNRWFKFVAPASGQINITVDTELSKGTQRRTQVALWQANGTTEIRSKRYISDYDDVVVGATGLTPGATYYISVDSFSGYYGTFTLCLNDKVDYDFYEGAIDVTTMINGCSVDAVYDTRGGSPDKTIGANWNNSGPLYNRWFKFVAPASGQINITVDTELSKGTQRRTQVALWQANGTTEIRSKRYISDYDDVVVGATGLTPGATYYISVDSFSGFYGTFTLCLNDKVDYDFYEGAIDVTSNINGCSLDAVYDTRGGSPDKTIGANWNNSGPLYNRWFKFVAPASGQINITVDTELSKGTQRRTQVALWQANGTTEIKSKRYISDYDDVVVGATGLTPGATYYISVDSFSGYYGTFTLCLNDKVDYDFYEGAIDVTTIINSCSADAIYDTRGATPDKIKGSTWNTGAGGNFNRWFKFVAPLTGQINVTVDIGDTKGSQRYSQVALWKSDGITEVKSNRYVTASSTEDVILGATNLIIGETYYISVDSFNNGTYGTFTLCLKDKVDYDYYEGAIDVTGIINSCSADAVYDTRGATPDKIKGSAWNNGGPLYNRWFKFVAPATGQINITVDIGDTKGTQYYSQLALWKDDGVTEIRSVRYTNTSQTNDISLGAIGLTPGSTYYISVDSFNTNTYGTFTLCLQDKVDYDFFEGAIDVTGIINSCSADAVYDTRGATPDKIKGSAWNNGGPLYNRWFKFVAPATGQINITVDIGDTKGTQYYSQLALWKDDGVTEIRSVRYTNTSQTNDISLGAIGLTPGSTYYISVDSFNTNTYGTFTLCLKDKVDYDFFEGAIDVTGIINSCSADAVYDTRGATPDKIKGSAWNNGGPLYNRWFKFVAPATGQINITVDIGDTKGTQYYSQLALWKDDGVTEISSVRYTNTSQTNDISLGAIGLTPGSTYYISVDSFNTNTYGTFTLCLEDITGLAATGPGGIRQDLRLWLRADVGTSTTTDGTAISTWNDQAKATNSIGTTGQLPIYKNNATDNINYNPVLDFSGNKSMYGQYATGYFTQDVFAVVIPNTVVNSSTPRMTIFSGETAPTSINDFSGIGFGNYTGAINNEVLTYAQGVESSYRVAEVSTTKSYVNAGIINARNSIAGNGMELFQNAIQVTNSTAGSGFANIIRGQYWLGKNKADTQGSLNGRIAEVITYTALNTAADRAKIESYLAIKYGITLGVNGISQNYVNSAGTVVWDVSANAGYNFDIAGIGRDNALTTSQLNQKQSKSSNSNTVVTLALGSFETTNAANTSAFGLDKSFLMWGNNNAALSDPGTSGDREVTVGTGVSSKIRLSGRRWKVVETGGDVSEVVVSVPLTALTSSFAKTASEDYVLVVSSTPGFENTNIVDLIPLRTVGSNLQTWYDFDGVKYFSFAKTTKQESKSQVSIGSGDYLVGENNINLGSSFTISAWIQNNGVAAARTVIAKGTDYVVTLNTAHKIEVAWNGTVRITANGTTLSDSKWHHIAVTFSGGVAVLYIDGIIERTVSSLPTPTATTSKFSIGAFYASKNAISNYFNGSIDEVGIWNTSLNAAQLQYIMNQEIEKFTDNTVNGKIIPQGISKNEIKPVPWANLAAYFDLNSVNGTTIENKANLGTSVRIKYLSASKQILNAQTAPLPYESITGGSTWNISSSWKNGAVQYLPNSSFIRNGVTTEIKWNIVRVAHSMASNANVTTLGLLVDGSTTVLSAESDSKIEVSNYLKLDGKIDLAGKSQLVQTLNSNLDNASTGSIEKDQQGVKSIYNYNYWSSPVASDNNLRYTVKSVMKDGSTLVPKDINWIGGYDGASTSPISLARYWLYKFDANAGVYANWSQINEDTFLRVGQGYTLKGSGASGTQNYTFLGRPNNGLITANTVSDGQLLLAGNPYPSALDSQAFINDNLSTVERGIDGTLYFWEQSSTSNSHVLGSYLGGYAVLNLSGGVAPVAPAGISGKGLSAKIPKRYIPVGQGFFVFGKSGGGGSILYNNNQRSFQKETDATSTTLFKVQSKKGHEIKSENNNSDPITDERYKKLRLGYNLTNGFHRQVLLAFMEDKATSKIDDGYDAFVFDDLPSDMFLLNGTDHLAIEGEGYFDVDASYPIGVKSDSEGPVQFMIDDLENFDDDQAVYLYDDETQIYHNIRKEPYEANIAVGEHYNRFYLKFFNPMHSIKDYELDLGILVYYSKLNRVLDIRNSFVDATVQTVRMYNTLGQLIEKWSVDDTKQFNIKLPVKEAATGIYIVKIETTAGVLSKKIIMN